MKVELKSTIYGNESEQTTSFEPLLALLRLTVGVPWTIKSEILNSTDGQIPLSKIRLISYIPGLLNITDGFWEFEFVLFV